MSRVDVKSKCQQESRHKQASAKKNAWNLSATIKRSPSRCRCIGIGGRGKFCHASSPSHKNHRLSIAHFLFTSSCSHNPVLQLANRTTLFIDTSFMKPSLFSVKNEGQSVCCGSSTNNSNGWNLGSKSELI